MRCDKCGSDKLHKNGFATLYSDGGRVKERKQRWYCRTCGTNTTRPILDDVEKNNLEAKNE